MLKILHANKPSYLIKCVGLLFFLLAINSYHMVAQHFEWAATSSNLFGGFKGGAVDAGGNFVVAGDMPELTYRTGGASLLYDASGEGHNVTEYSSSLLVASYTPEGQINWIQKVKIYGRDRIEFAGIAADNKGNIYLLANAREMVFTEDKREFNKQDQYDYNEDENNTEAEEETDPGNHVLICFNTEGKTQWIRRDPANNIRSVTSFEISPLGGFVIAGRTEKDIKTVKGLAQAGQGGNNYVIKTDERLNVEWANLVQYHAPSCCTYNIPACKAKVAPDGTVYTTGVYRFGATFSNGTKFTAPVVDKPDQYNQPYESYVACIKKDGKLAWAKPSGSKSIFSAITATSKGVFVSGNLQAGHHVFGHLPDTTNGKRMLVAGFSTKGKCEWVKTTNGNNSTSIVADANSNIYIAVESKLAGPKNPLILEKDTIESSYSQLIVASYDKDGNYRWYKKSSVSMSSNEFPALAIDNCGNIFIAGEMWYTLKVQTSWFDAAFVKGDGYGAAPIVAKLKNSIEVSKNQNNKTQGHETVNTPAAGSYCIISPGPWEVMNYPNPFRERTTLRLTTTYDDKNIQMQVFSLKGQLMATIFSNKNLQTGRHEFVFDAQAINLAAGIYVVVVKGSQTAASCEIVVQR